jgi:hypothetical protein
MGVDLNSHGPVRNSFPRRRHDQHDDMHSLAHRLASAIIQKSKVSPSATAAVQRLQRCGLPSTTYWSGRCFANPRLHRALDRLPDLFKTVDRIADSVTQQRWNLV